MRRRWPCVITMFHLFETDVLTPASRYFWGKQLTGEQSEISSRTSVYGCWRPCLNALALGICISTHLIHDQH
jgi:hypothetical protein